jgi:hypothetical protein
MTVSSPNVIESKLDRLFDDMRFLRSQMIAFDRNLKGIEACLKPGEPSEQQPESKSRPWFAAAASAKDSFDFVCSRGSNRGSLALSGNMTRQRDCDLRVSTRPPSEAAKPERSSQASAEIASNSDAMRTQQALFVAKLVIRCDKYHKGVVTNITRPTCLWSKERNDVIRRSWRSPDDASATRSLPLRSLPLTTIA